MNDNIDGKAVVVSTTEVEKDRYIPTNTSDLFISILSAHSFFNEILAPLNGLHVILK
jgi:hypothetical protein